MTEEAEKQAQGVLDCWNRSGVWGARDCPELKRAKHCANCRRYSRAGRLLLDRESPEGSRKEWTELVAAREDGQREEHISVFLFRIGREWFGLATAHFLEVLEERPVHSIPHRSGPILKGLVNVRGELQLCLSLAALLEVNPGGDKGDEDPEKTKERMLFVQRDGDRLVFQVTEAHGCHRYRPEELMDVPATLAGTASDYTKGLLSWKGMHVSVLDEGPLFERIARSLS
ncbi:MAG: chemotaxis protein CheW [Thermodesulfobacteriota bacterium]